MNIFKRFHITHRALYGTDPCINRQSHSPFGMDVSKVKEIINKDEVDKFLKAYQKELRDHIPKGIFSFVKGEGSLYVAAEDPSWVLVGNLENGWYEYKQKVSYRIPQQGEVDTLKEGIYKSLNCADLYVTGSAVYDQSTQREGVIIDDFTRPLKYKDDRVADTLIYTGQVQFKNSVETLPIHRLKLL